MTVTAEDVAALADVARDAAQAAGDLITAARATRIEHKEHAVGEAAAIVTEVDVASEALILERLEPTVASFGFAVLAEEGPDDLRRLETSHFWSVDPLDGTLPFVEGRPGSAVSIALVRGDGVPVVGVVHDLATRTTWQAVVGQGVTCDGVPWSAEENPADVLTVFADRSLLASDDDGSLRDALDAVALAAGCAGSVVHVGAGAVMNAIGALGSPAGCYLKLPVEAGGGSLWDFAATACIYAEAGAVVSDVAGRTLDLNRPDATSMGHRGVLFATNEKIAGGLRELAKRRIDPAGAG